MGTDTLAARLRQRERELEAVRRITAALHAKTSPEELVRDTLLTAVETVGAVAGSVLLHDPEKDQLVFRYVIGEKARVLTGYRMSSDQGVAGRVFQSGAGEITYDALADPRHYRALDEREGFRTRNMVTVPLRTMAGRAIGVMQILNKEQGDFQETDRAVLEILSGQAASAIETALLYEEARLATIAREIGNIGHDIKNMVTPTVLCLSTLQRMLAELFAGLDGLRSPDEAPFWEQVDAVTHRARSHYELICQMASDGVEAVQGRAREIAEAVKGEVSPPNFAPANPIEVVQHVLRDLQLTAARAGVDLCLDAPEDPGSVDLDSRRFYNAIYNLVNNALAETPPGGQVRVELARLANGPDRDEATLRVLVADTGCGMPEDVRESLFTDRVISTKPAGTGLGTRIVKNVVDLHRGQIAVASAPGEGTRFTIHLPVRQPAGDSRTNPSPAACD
jgi:signal transduction histidine kinase